MAQKDFKNWSLLNCKQHWIADRYDWLAVEHRGTIYGYFIRKNRIDQLFRNR